MRNLLLFIPVLLLVLTQCNKEEEQNSSPEMTVTINGIDNNKFTIGENYTINIDASAKENKTLSTIELTNTGQSENETITVNDNSYAGSFTYLSPDSGVTTTIIITAKDSDLKSTEQTFTVKGPKKETSFTQTNGGYLYHVESGELAAFDLVNDVVLTIAGSEINKDMINTDANQATFTGSWEGGTNNNTKFVNITGGNITFSSATVEQITTSYLNGDPTGTINNPQQDNIYAVLLRTGDYAILKINTIIENENTCLCSNKGKMTFSYRKE